MNGDLLQNGMFVNQKHRLSSHGAHGKRRSCLLELTVPYNGGQWQTTFFGEKAGAF
jgi:hypothetical protein